MRRHSLRYEMWTGRGCSGLIDISVVCISLLDIFFVVFCFVFEQVREFIVFFFFFTFFFPFFILFSSATL
ncbi:hypothetical protein FN846DRAFT_926842 [Sphaerosporella brunnea]|uniref:Uncharacterized protein n=1 Tax=Sphaerosporella brunnea TaxID=1250544 RepID=A0A5J5FBV0_9PEZI|nr:hypothetical protein FN846DRAFT_926842 [Sphaerosporella brunnea]